MTQPASHVSVSPFKKKKKKRKKNRKKEKKRERKKEREKNKKEARKEKGARGLFRVSLFQIF